MAVTFEAPIDSVSMTTKTNGDMVVIEVAGVHLAQNDAINLTQLINSGEALKVKIKLASES